jgi:hypothetical protein
MEQH